MNLVQMVIFVGRRQFGSIKILQSRSVFVQSESTGSEINMEHLRNLNVCVRDAMLEGHLLIKG